MNRTISQLEIALLRSSLALWSIEFCRFRKIRAAPSRVRTIFFLPNRILATRMGRTENGARSALLLGGMPGGLGIASAIEPAGGVSPLRGGAEVCRMWSYRQGVAPNYRS